MNRKDFLKAALFGSAAVCAACLGACSKDEMQGPAVNLPSGGLESITRNGIIVVHYEQDDFRALSVACTHQGTPVIYNSGAKNLRCPNHGSIFTISGSVTQGPASRGLMVYPVSRMGNVLKVG
jgi:cytochrome b6-f complex iron-sulfur subunit